MTDRVAALAGTALVSGVLGACFNPVGGPAPDGGALGAPDAAASASPDAAGARPDAGRADAGSAGSADAGRRDAGGAPRDCSRFSFDMWSSQFAGAGTVSAGAGDFDGDQLADLAVVRFGTKVVEVLRNEGGGKLALQRTLSISGEASALAAGDLDGDGRPDLAVAQNGAGAGLPVTVLLNRGEAGFAAPVDYPTGYGPPSIALGRFHGDRKADLAVANLGNYALMITPTVSVLLNAGDGAFAPKAEYPVGSMPMAVATGRLDADDLDDLVVSNGYVWNTVAVLLNEGDGTFAPKVEYPTGDDPRSLAVLDLNGDGRDDVVTGNERGADVSVLLNAGDGTLGAAARYPVGEMPTDVLLADMDGDGQPDLVVSRYGGAGGVDILPNQGDGTFGPACSIVQRVYLALALGDFDADGKVDLAAFDQVGPVDVLLNRSHW